jgi:hypothetical protein
MYIHLNHPLIYIFPIVLYFSLSADSTYILRPEILAACMKIDSAHDSSIVPKLRASIKCQRVSLHFVNNFYFGGRGNKQ